MSFLSRLLNRVRRRALERDFDDEVRAHLDLRIDANLRRGMSREDAEADAFRRFGSVEEAMDGMRQARGVRRMSRRRAAFVLGVPAAVSPVAIAGLLLVPQGPAYYEIGQDNVVPPAVVNSPRPTYTAEAMEAGVEGRVVLECVVGTDGACEEPRVVQSLDPQGLDLQATAALRQWQFRPGQRSGDPVPVLVNVEMTFTLR